MTKDLQMQNNKEILIIGRNFHPDGKETAAVIAGALKPYLEEKGLSGRLLLLKDIVFDISNDGIKVLDAVSGKDLREYGAVLMTNWFSHASIRKDMALTLALYFDKHRIPVFNSEALHSRSTSKLSQMMLAALNGVAIPRTVFSLSLKRSTEYARQQQFPVPFIFKDAQASRGKANYLLHSFAETKDHEAEHSEDHPFMIQDRIESDGSDFRFFVTGGTIRLVIKRTGSAGSHLNNTSTGATTEVLGPETFDPAVTQAVTAMSRILYREVTGIDIMFDKNTGEHYFLEANPIPQIATGSNVELKLRALADAFEEAIEGAAS